LTQIHDAIEAITGIISAGSAVVGFVSATGGLVNVLVKPLEGTGDMATVLQRPHPALAQAAGPPQRLGEPAITDHDRPVAHPLARARGDGGEGV
jgi:hypothetical protein